MVDTKPPLFDARDSKTGVRVRGVVCWEQCRHFRKGSPCLRELCHLKGKKPAKRLAKGFGDQEDDKQLV